MWKTFCCLRWSTGWVLIVLRLCNSLCILEVFWSLQLTDVLPPAAPLIKKPPFIEASANKLAAFFITHLVLISKICNKFLGLREACDCSVLMPCDTLLPAFSRVNRKSWWWRIWGEWRIIGLNNGPTFQKEKDTPWTKITWFAWNNQGIWRSTDSNITPRSAGSDCSSRWSWIC